MINEVHLWDLPENKVYLKIEDSVRKAFFSHATKLSGNKTKLDKFLGLHRVRRRGYETGVHFCPLWVIKKILSVTPEKEKRMLMALIERSINELRKGYGGEAKSIKNPKLPIKFSPTLSRIVGHLIGDGGIRRNHMVHYTSQFKTFIEQFKKDITKVFGNIESYEYKDESTYQINFPSIVGLILVTFFGQMVGKLKHVPQQVMNADKKSKALFLRALFDDEGTVNPSSYKIEFEITLKNVVEKMKEMLKEFGIRPGKAGKRKESENCEIPRTKVRGVSVN